MEPGTKYPCVLFVYGGPHVQVSEILVSAAAQFERNSETETRKLSSNAEKQESQNLVRSKVS